jgi:hypothetical protein
MSERAGTRAYDGSMLRYEGVVASQVGVERRTRCQADLVCVFLLISHVAGCTCS